MGLDSGTLTPLLKRMQGNGIIKRERGTKDERQLHVTLTQKGENLRNKAVMVNKEIACATQCTSKERDAILQSLFQLRKALSPAKTFNKIG